VIVVVPLAGLLYVASLIVAPLGQRFERSLLDRAGERTVETAMPRPAPLCDHPIDGPLSAPGSVS
jgi:hypothetical protein